ncbi:MAG: AMP-binding protein, partial [Bryobacteraceae bacterium]
MTQNPYASRPWLKHYDPWVPAETTLPGRSLYHLLTLAASQYRHRTATAFQGAELTFGELKEQAERLASALHAMGISKGDRVGIMMPNSPQYMIAFFALMRLGAICANFNPAYTAREVEHQANDAGIRAMITLDTIAPTILGLQAKTRIETVIVTSLAEYSEGAVDLKAMEGTVSYTGLIRGVETVSLPRVECDAANDIAVLQYTGGTTGVSKGAMLTHQSIYANVIQVSHWGGYFTRKGEERMIVVIPYFHIYALSVCMLLSCWNGTMQILVPKFDINVLIANFRKYKPSYFPGVPTLYISLLNHEEARTCGIEEVKVF